MTLECLVSVGASLQWSASGVVSVHQFMCVNWCDSLSICLCVIMCVSLSVCMLFVSLCVLVIMCVVRQFECHVICYLTNRRLSGAT